MYSEREKVLVSKTILPRLCGGTRVKFPSMALEVRYLKSAVFAKDYPMGDRPEVAIAGRSNAGKSSFINALTKSKIAKVSQTPGKTKILSFFDVGQHYRLVDTPGYGFAARSNEEMKDWQTMIEDYLSLRGNLVGLVLIMDINRDWEQDEAMLVNFMNAVAKPVVVVLTKADKYNKQEIQKRKNILQKTSGVRNLFVVSSIKNTGVEEVEDFLFRGWVKPYKGLARE